MIISEAFLVDVSIIRNNGSRTFWVLKRVNIIK